MSKAKYQTRSAVKPVANAQPKSKRVAPSRASQTRQNAAAAAETIRRDSAKDSPVKKPVKASDKVPTARASSKPFATKDGLLSQRGFTLEPLDNQRLASLNGPFDATLRTLELKLGIQIFSRGNIYELSGKASQLKVCESILRELYLRTESASLGDADLFMLLKDVEDVAQQSDEERKTQEVIVKTRKGAIKGRGNNQRKYLHQIATNDINFGIGPAGTGKTYLAVAMAVEALETNRVQRLLLVRPAVEAGEKLGFLPGDLVQKVDPYLRPLYDALYEMLGVEKVGRLMERNVIEIAPLAFMRGRTLNDAFILLDEAQNTTVEQMKMFLTRIGFGSTAVITGDMTQVDLPRHIRSGLKHSIEVLKGVEGISFTFFEAADVVRHPLVQRIVMAYERFEAAADIAPKTTL